MFKFALASLLSLCLIVPCFGYPSGRSGGGGFSSSRGGSSFSSGSRSSGSGFSSSKSSGSSWGSSSKSSSGFSSKPSSSSSSSKSNWGTSNSSSSFSSKSSTTSTARPSSSTTSQSATHADTRTYEIAKSSGKAFTTKSEALEHFKKTEASKYTTTFKTEPKTRPTYIPKTYSVGGQNVNIVYHNGGYGYYHPVTHTWMAYNVMHDMAMMSMLMGNHGYYVGSPPVVVSSGVDYALGIFFFIFALIIVVAIVISLIGGCDSCKR